MTSFTESPTIWIFIGAIILGACLFFYVTTKKRFLLPFMAGGLLLIILPLVIDSMVETDREELRRRVYEMARCVRRNDVAALLRYVSPEATDTRARIEKEMPSYRFSACSVSGGLKQIDFDSPTVGAAQVSFVVYVYVDAPSYSHKGMAYRGVGLTFKEFDQGWMVTHFSHFPPNSRYNPESFQQNWYLGR